MLGIGIQTTRGVQEGFVDILQDIVSNSQTAKSQVTPGISCTALVLPFSSPPCTHMYITAARL